MIGTFLLPAMVLVVGISTNWAMLPMIDTVWLHNIIIVGLCLALLWRQIAFKVQGWQIGAVFASVIIWPIVRVYGGIVQ